MAGGVGVNEKKKLMTVFGTLPLEMALSSLQVSMGKKKMACFLKKGVMWSLKGPCFPGLKVFSSLETQFYDPVPTTPISGSLTTN